MWLPITAASLLDRTVKRNDEVLRAMFGYAVRNDWLARTPCRNIVLPSIDGTRRYELSIADVGRIATHLPERYQVMVWLGVTLGLRWSEVAALRVGHFDLGEGQLSVTEAIVWVGSADETCSAHPSPTQAGGPCSCRTPSPPCW